ncbi:hypothetical protein D3C85_737380 [compost metagenome]
MHFARWYKEYDPETSEISLEDKLLRDKLVALMMEYSQEMENYSYYGHNPGVPDDNLEDIADAILLKFKVEEL